MRRRNYKSIILSCLVMLLASVAMMLPVGCSDNPEAKAAKEMRSRTVQAVQMSVEEKDFEAAEKLLQQNRSQGLTKDVALLASGNLALAKGRTMQEDLGLKTLPLHGGVDRFDSVLRNTEDLLIEQMRIEALLETDKQELAELRQWLQGSADKEGLTQQQQQANQQMEQLLAQKTEVQVEQNLTQIVLDDYQSKADNLMREAELSDGDKRLELEEQAFSILLERKDHYIKAQEAENNIEMLDNKIALVQVRLDGINQAIEETQQRIDAIINSEPRITLQEQSEEISTSVSNNLRQLDLIAGELTAGLKGYRNDADTISAVYEDAISKFQQINSNAAAAPATLRSADGAFYVAMTCSSYTKIYKDITERLQAILDSTDPDDPTLASAVQGKLPEATGLSTEYVNKMMAYFDQAIEGYEDAFEQSGSLSDQARCSIRKSQLLALHSKMQIADTLEAFDLANSTETAINALIEKSSELGACFTQSEAMKVVTQGLDYMPSLPLNMEIFLESKKQQLSEWKRLPIEEREEAVAANIQEIDELIAQYGPEVESQLAPLKQEMITARENDFVETGTSATPGFNDPNSL